MEKTLQFCLAEEFFDEGKFRTTTEASKQRFPTSLSVYVPAIANIRDRWRDQQTDYSLFGEKTSF
jgi:hypothetical protein